MFVNAFPRPRLARSFPVRLALAAWCADRLQVYPVMVYPVTVARGDPGHNKSGVTFPALVWCLDFLAVWKAEHTNIFYS